MQQSLANRGYQMHPSATVRVTPRATIVRIVWRRPRDRQTVALLLRIPRAA